MDVAMLSGVSTVEWIESMERAGTQRRMPAGHAKEDAYLVAVLRDRKKRQLVHDDAGTAARRSGSEDCAESPRGLDYA
jgi:hypothetical protein